MVIPSGGLESKGMWGGREGGRGREGGIQRYVGEGGRDGAMGGESKWRTQIQRYVTDNRSQLQRAGLWTSFDLFM